MKKCIRLLINVLPLILSVIGCVAAILTKKPWIIVSTEDSFHFSLITVNALFGGFLYTNYSLLIGLLDNSIVEKIKNTDIIKKRNSHILKGIIYSTTSVVAGLYLVLFSPYDSFIQKVLYSFALNVEIVFMAFLIVYFLLSLREMSILINNIHNPQGKKTDNEIKKLKEQIRNNAKK